MFLIPGSSFKGQLPAFSSEELISAQRMQDDVITLSEFIGERNVANPDSLKEAENFIFNTFEGLGYYTRRETYSANGVEVSNIEATIVGKRKQSQIVVIGAHYDSAEGTPGANDNATGVAGVLELARYFKEFQPEKTVRFVAFVNEEPPYFYTDFMGSQVYASNARKRKEQIAGMISLECLGVYSDLHKSQAYPPPLEKFYPEKGDFIALCSNPLSYPLLRRSIKIFRKSTRFPSEGIFAPEKVTGIGWSDHASFWKYGYQAIMITDTAFLRDRHYHTSTDTAERIDFKRMARVISGVGNIISGLSE